MAFAKITNDIAYISNTKEIDHQKLPIVFIHGAGETYHTWKYQVEAYFDRCYQIAPDLPKHGRSKGSLIETIESFCDFVKNFIDVLDLKEIVLAGHSMGGAIAQMFALKYPDILTGLILVGTGARLRVNSQILDGAKKGESYARYAYADTTDKKIIEEAEKEFFLTEPIVRYTDLVACDRFEIMDQISNIGTKALIICGDKDIITPIKYGRYLHENIPNSILKIVKDAGHMVMWEKPAQTNEAIRKFLKEVS